MKPNAKIWQKLHVRSNDHSFFLQNPKFLDNLVEKIGLKFLMFAKIPVGVELLHGKLEMNQNMNNLIQIA